MAATLELDEVIDPADTRQCILRGLKASAPAEPRNSKKLRFVAPWKYLNFKFGIVNAC